MAYERAGADERGEGGREGVREGGRRMCSLVLKHLPNYWAN